MATLQLVESVCYFTLKVQHLCPMKFWGEVGWLRRHSVKPSNSYSKTCHHCVVALRMCCKNGINNTWENIPSWRNRGQKGEGSRSRDDADGINLISKVSRISQKSLYVSNPPKGVFNLCVIFNFFWRESLFDPCCRCHLALIIRPSETLCTSSICLHQS